MKKILAFTALLIVLASCAAPSPQPMPALVLTETPLATLPNPASVYCEEQGNILEIRTAADGSQSGVCIFPNGSACDEWAYYRGECKPGVSLITPEAATTQVVTEPTPDAPSDAASDGCNIYRDTGFGYSFHYPADAQIIHNDDPLGGISIIGPVQDGESWPVFVIAHPHDREEYRPPEDFPLLQWLADHYLLGATQMPDMQIAGRTAIHLRQERSPQSYAYDRYYFAKSGQLYMVLIGHAGDKEDWGLYNHFLESIQFEQTTVSATDPIAIPTAQPIDPADYQGWWTYTHAVYGFSIMLPEDWIVEETTTFDPLMSGHILIFLPEYAAERESIRMTFRSPGEEVLLWPTGAGQGEFIQQGTLDVAGGAARRMLFVCPTGEVTSIYYYGEDGPNIRRGKLEFAFIFNAGSYCEAGYNLGGKVQYMGEMIVASLKVP